MKDGEWALRFGHRTHATVVAGARLALMAPLCVKGVAFPPVDGAPVLAAVKQTALDCGCGSALGQGVGNAAKKGLGQRKLAA